MKDKYEALSLSDICAVVDKISELLEAIALNTDKKRILLIEESEKASLISKNLERIIELEFDPAIISTGKGYALVGGSQVDNLLSKEQIKGIKWFGEF